jgi:hypothetical protein
VLCIGLTIAVGLVLTPAPSRCTLKDVEQGDALIAARERSAVSPILTSN